MTAGVDRLEGFRAGDVARRGCPTDAVAFGDFTEASGERPPASCSARTPTSTASPSPPT